MGIGGILDHRTAEFFLCRISPVVAVVLGYGKSYYFVLLLMVLHPAVEPNPCLFLISGFEIPRSQGVFCTSN